MDCWVLLLVRCQRYEHFERFSMGLNHRLHKIYRWTTWLRWSARKKLSPPYLDRIFPFGSSSKQFSCIGHFLALAQPHTNPIPYIFFFLDSSICQINTVIQGTEAAAVKDLATRHVAVLMKDWDELQGVPASLEGFSDWFHVAQHLKF